MAHELESKNGVARMFYVGEKPWHGLGIALEKEVTSAAAIRFAQLDWTVQKQPISVNSQVMDGFQASVRVEDGKPLGIVRDTYRIIQNVELFDFMDTLIGESAAIYHTAGSLRGGSRVFITAKLPNDMQIGPDKVEKYILLASSHDGSLAMHIKWTPVRVVCQNTLSSALNIGGEQVESIAIRHTKNYAGRVDMARKVLQLTDVYYSNMDKLFQRLVASPMSDSEFNGFAKDLVPCRSDEKQAVTRVQNIVGDLGVLFNTGVGNEATGVNHTRWAAYNAVTEYVDHHKKIAHHKGSDDKTVRMESLIWGKGADIKNKALQLLGSAN